MPITIYLYKYSFKRKFKFHIFGNCYNTIFTFYNLNYSTYPTELVLLLNNCVLSISLLFCNKFAYNIITFTITDMMEE